MNSRFLVCLLISYVAAQFPTPKMPAEYSMSYYATVIFQSPYSYGKEIGTFYWQQSSGNWRNDGTALKGMVVTTLQIASTKTNYFMGYAPNDNNNPQCQSFGVLINNPYQLANYFVNGTYVGESVANGVLCHTFTAPMKYYNGNGYLDLTITGHFDVNTGYPVQLEEEWPSWYLVFQVFEFQPSIPDGIFEIPKMCSTSPFQDFQQITPILSLHK